MRHSMWLLLGASLAACGGTAPVADRVAEANVRARLDSWVKAFNLHSAEALAPFYSPTEYLSVAGPNGQRSYGWTDESQRQRDFLPAVTAMNLVVQSPRVTLVRKNLALVTFPFTLDIAAAGNRQIGPGQGTMLWQYESGEWRIYTAQLSYTRAMEAQVTPQRR